MGVTKMVSLINTLIFRHNDTCPSENLATKGLNFHDIKFL